MDQGESTKRQSIDWGATLILNSVRAVVAGLVFTLVFSFLAAGQTSVGELFTVLLVSPIVMLSLALIFAVLLKMNIPFVGLLSFVFGLWYLLADPIMKIIHGQNKALVPVEEYRLFNFTMIILVYRQ